MNRFICIRQLSSYKIYLKSKSIDPLLCDLIQIIHYINNKRVIALVDSSMQAWAQAGFDLGGYTAIIFRGQFRK